MKTTLTLSFLCLILTSISANAQTTCYKVGDVYNCHGTPQRGSSFSGAIVDERGVTPLVQVNPPVSTGIQPIQPLPTLEPLPFTPRSADPFMNQSHPTIIAPLPLGEPLLPLE